ncbi:MAG: hypothetical protein QXF45_07895 [Candidatus Caldarchaeum sp.]
MPFWPIKLEKRDYEPECEWQVVSLVGENWDKVFEVSLDHPPDHTGLHTGQIP